MHATVIANNTVDRTDASANAATTCQSGHQRGERERPVLQHQVASIPTVPSRSAA
jgi:hypothetical protein